MVGDSDSHELVPLAEGVKGKGEFMPLEDPLEAIEHIARFQPDIILCPISMNAWDGLQVLQMLRSNPRLSHIQIVFMTDSREEPSRRLAAEKLSGFPLLPRPPSPGQVSERVDRIRSMPGFSVRKKRTSYGDFVRDVLQKAHREKETRRKALEHEAHLQHLAGWVQFVHSELKEAPRLAASAEPQAARNYYLS